MSGSNKHSQLGQESTFATMKAFNLVSLIENTKIIQIACSIFHTMVLTEEGDIYTWGGSLRGKRGKGASVRFSGNKHVPCMVESLFNSNIKI
mmetsp:Transcript_27448/g.19816  ORF Transcript_27448/g.19816 Transcript_27448/m.19816 type:complete len:92 (+) Transcript_27448:556-831(+)